MGNEKDRIEWIALLRGFSIILVVMFHVQLIDKSTGENHLFCKQLSDPFSLIRMPLFIFSSGGLLYISRIKKEWNTGRLYVDKFYRILCPFLFFVTFFYILKIVTAPLVKTKVTFSLMNFLESFMLFYNHPSAHLWFLSVLMWFMLLYPLFKWLCRHECYMLLALLLSGAFFFVDLSSLFTSDYFCIGSLNKYLVFFLLGISFFRFELHKYIDNWSTLLLLAVGYVLFFINDVPLLPSLIGIAVMVNLSQIVARHVPHLFSSFREYIYQIYLMSFIFQPFVELVLWKSLFYNEQLVVFFYFLNILSGLFMPVYVSKLVERINCHPLQICLGLSCRSLV